MTSILKTDEIQSQNGGAVVKMQTLKHPSASGNNLELASDGNVSITNTLSAGTIGSNVVFPTGNIINAGYLALSNNLSKTSSFSTDSFQLGTSSNTAVLKSTSNKVLLNFTAFVNKTSGGTGNYFYANIHGGGFGSSNNSSNQLTGGLLYGQSVSEREFVNFQILDTNPGATNPSYSIYWTVVGGQFDFEFQKISYIEIQG